MISLRLQTISNFLEKDDKLADIGCDHGYLATLALSKGITYIQLIDNKIGPLENAKENLKNESLIYTLSSGLDDIDSNIDTISMCGMGGDLIINLLNDNLEKTKKLKKIILQPNRNEFELRLFLRNNGFKITNEDIVFERNQYYEIIVCLYNKDIVDYSYEDLFFGPILRSKRSQVFIDKWNKFLSHYEDIYSKFNSCDIKEKIITINKEINKKSQN